MSEGFHVHGGTLVVAIMETNQIVIAIDSRATANRPGQTNSFQDGFEKVTQLSKHVVFFFTGAGIFQSLAFTNNLADTAKDLASDWTKNNRRIPLDSLANNFKAIVKSDLSRLTVADIEFLHRVATKGGGTQVFQAVFAGMDFDAAFRMFKVTCNSIVETNDGKIDARLSFDVAEQKRNGNQWFLFFGSTKVFGDGMNDPKAPLAPFMRQLKASNSRLAEPTAASLLAAGVRDYGDGPDSSVGYPLFVYVIDADGFRMTRKVGKGQTVPFDPRDQGK